MADRKAFTLSPLVLSGVFEPGPRKLSCAVGGIDYFAELGPIGEIIFEGKTFKSPSAFSVYVKRKINPGRKADDGWTSVKYNGNTLDTYRSQLEQYAAGGEYAAAGSAGQSSPIVVSGRQKRRTRPKHTLHEWSDDEDSPVRNHHEPEVASDQGYTDMEDEDELDDGEYLLDQDMDMEPDLSGEGPVKVERKDHLVPGETTWIQCENPLCQKWRRVKYADVPTGHWFCNDNKDSRYASCDRPQELPDEQIDQLLEEEAMARHAVQSQRPPLERCAPEEFEADLFAFLTATGQENYATLVREKRITCNNSPLDVFGLYREVIRRGGFIANERYDDRGRWTGSINFAGDIFPRMKNWTSGNKATSVGNQLLNNYKKFLLGYERAFAFRDLAGRLPARRQEQHQEPPRERESRQQQGGGGTDALAFLADVAGATDENELAAPAAKGAEPPAATRPSYDGSGYEHGSRGRRSEEGGPAKRLKTMQEYGGVVQAVPGQILLAQDPRDLGKHWAVAVADTSDLPQPVAAGEAMVASTQAFPLSMQEACPDAQAAAAGGALPVLVLGTTWLGWVEASACRPYSLEAGQSALNSAMAAVLRSARGEPSGTPLTEADQPLLACVRGLKRAAQYCCSASSMPGLPRTWVQAASTGVSAARLLDFEGQLPSSAVRNNCYTFWERWRTAVEVARTPAELATQILVLKSVLSPEATRPDQSDALLAELDELIGIAAIEPEAGPVRGFRGLPQEFPTCLSIDEAVSVLYDVMDWAKLRRLWSSVPQASTALENERERDQRPRRAVQLRKLAEGGTSSDHRGHAAAHRQLDGAFYRRPPRPQLLRASGNPSRRAPLSPAMMAAAAATAAAMGLVPLGPGGTFVAGQGTPIQPRESTSGAALEASSTGSPEHVLLEDMPRGTARTSRRAAAAHDRRAAVDAAPSPPPYTRAVPPTMPPPEAAPPALSPSQLLTDMQIEQQPPSSNGGAAAGLESNFLVSAVVAPSTNAHFDLGFPGADLGGGLQMDISDLIKPE